MKNRADAMDEMVERRYGRSWLYINILDSVDNDGRLYPNILGSVDNGGWLYRLWIIVACCELLLSAVIRLLNYSFLYSVSTIFPFSLFSLY